jgi:proline dehydrogenase
VDLAMRMLGNQFVTGQTIEEALRNGVDNENAVTVILTTCSVKRR